MELQSVLQKQFLWSNELNWLCLQAVSSLAVQSEACIGRLCSTFSVFYFQELLENIYYFPSTKKHLFSIVLPVFSWMG